MFLSGNILSERMFLSGNIERMFLSGNILSVFRENVPSMFGEHRVPR